MINESLRKQNKSKGSKTLFQCSSVFVLISVCLFCYLIYKNIFYSSQVKEKTAELLHIQSLYKQNKADINDLSIKMKNIQQQNFTIAKEIESLHSSIVSESIDMNILDDNIKAKKSRLQSLQIQLNEMNKDIETHSALIRDHNQIITLQKKIEEIKGSLNSNGINSSNEIIGIDSKILTTNRQIEAIRKWMNIKVKFDLKLLYRESTESNNTPRNFHRRCDIRPHTLILIKGENGLIIGGYTSMTWDGDEYKEDHDAFIFNLSNEKKYAISDPSKAILTNGDLLPIFGNFDISIYPSLVVSHFPQSYGAGNQKMELTNGEKFFKIVDFEVFQIVI